MTWTTHLTRYRSAHPQKCFKECLIEASKTYRNSSESPDIRKVSDKMLMVDVPGYPGAHPAFRIPMLPALFQGDEVEQKGTFPVFLILEKKIAFGSPLSKKTEAKEYKLSKKDKNSKKEAEEYVSTLKPHSPLNRFVWHRKDIYKISDIDGIKDDDDEEWTGWVNWDLTDASGTMTLKHAEGKKKDAKVLFEMKEGVLHPMTDKLFVWLDNWKGGANKQEQQKNSEVFDYEALKASIKQQNNMKKLLSDEYRNEYKKLAHKKIDHDFKEFQKELDAQIKEKKRAKEEAKEAAIRKAWAEKEAKKQPEREKSMKKMALAYKKRQERLKKIAEQAARDRKNHAAERNPQGLKLKELTKFLEEKRPRTMKEYDTYREGRADERKKQFALVLQDEAMRKAKDDEKKRKKEAKKKKELQEMKKNRERYQKKKEQEQQDEQRRRKEADEKKKEEMKERDEKRKAEGDVGKEKYRIPLLKRP